MIFPYEKAKKLYKRCALTKNMEPDHSKEQFKSIFEDALAEEIINCNLKRVIASFMDFGC
jgi:hypothetical protein